MNLTRKIGRSICSPVIVAITFAFVAQIAFSCDILQEIWNVEDSFHELENEGQFRNTSSSILVARKIKKLMHHDEYPNVPASYKSSFENLKNKLPTSVKNLVFAKEICIRNTWFDEFLVAASDTEGGYGNDTQRRSIYTEKVPGNSSKPDQFKWYVDFINDNTLEILSKKYKGDKLFRDAYLAFHDEQEKRMVYAYRERYLLLGSNGGNRLAWNPEVNGDELLLRNDDSKEYLFADEQSKAGNERRYVFTYTQRGTPMADQWEIIDCSTPEKSFWNKVTNSLGFSK